MDRFETDWASLKKPLTLLAVVACVSLAHICFSGYYRHDQQAVLDRARAELEMQRSKYHLAVEAGDILQTSQQRYADLRQRYFIGDEKRLLWIESLRSSGRKEQLYNLRYSLKQQRPVYSDEESFAYYAINASSMSLHLELRHEGHLVGFFEKLKQDRAAVYQLRACSLSSKFGEDGIQFDSANIFADCDLLWYTLRPLSEQQEGDYENG
jgi:hypothetical protein